MRGAASRSVHRFLTSPTVHAPAAPPHRPGRPGSAATVAARRILCLLRASERPLPADEQVVEMPEDQGDVRALLIGAPRDEANRLKPGSTLTWPLLGWLGGSPLKGFLVRRMR